MSGIIPLPIQTVNEKDALLQELIEELAVNLIDDDDKGLLEEYISRFRSIYGDGYRHMYSKLYAIVVKIEKDAVEDIECLNSNLEIIRLHSCHSLEKEPELYAHILKLSDHLNLEIQRMSLYLGPQNQTVNLEIRLEQMRKEYEDLLDKHNRMAEKVDRHSLESVSVLAIFSAIVVAFTGGLGIIGNAMTDLSSVDPWMLMFSISLCGLVLFNTVAFLINAVSKLVSRGLLSKDSSETLSWGYIVCIDGLLIVLLVVSAVLLHIQ